MFNSKKKKPVLELALLSYKLRILLQALKPHEDHLRKVNLHLLYMEVVLKMYQHIMIMPLKELM